MGKKDALREISRSAKNNDSPLDLTVDVQRSDGSLLMHGVKRVYRGVANVVARVSRKRKRFGDVARSCFGGRLHREE